MVESFAERWRRKEIECGFDDAETTMIACGDEMLPDSAAPCLSFEEASQPRPLWDVFGTTSWSAKDRQRLAECRMIGSDGAGSPLCIDEGSGAVVLLDHEDGFRTQQFVNSSVHQLAECLLAYMGETSPAPLEHVVRAIDPEALTAGSFWHGEMAMIGLDD